MMYISLCLLLRQLCVVEAVSLLTHQVCVDHFPHQLDTLLLSLLPLMVVGYHGNDMSGRVLKAVAGSGLSRVHPLLQDLKSVKTSQGTCNIIKSSAKIQDYCYAV